MRRGVGLTGLQNANQINVKNNTRIISLLILLYLF